MPNYIKYQKSIAEEFKAYENRVRYIIDDHHWGEDGRYKEIILMNYLKRILPNNISVGTGFVKSKTGISKQIDIIIYDATYPKLFSDGDFVIVIPESVLGIIEVKSKINSSAHLKKCIEKANYNANIICENKEKFIFNGLFSYQRRVKLDNIATSIEQLDYTELIQKQYVTQPYSNRLKNCVNHIVCSSNTFLKFWLPHEEAEYRAAHYSLYKMPEDLAVGYFISNLQEFVFRYMSGRFLEDLPDGLKDFYYPLEEGKEVHCIRRMYMTNREV